MATKAILVVRPFDTVVPEEGDPYDVPSVPAGWTVRPEIGPLYTVTHPSGNYVHAYWVETASGRMEQAGKGVFILVGEASHLRYIADRVTNYWVGLSDLRGDNSNAAKAIKNAWKDDRPLDDLGNPVGVLVALRLTVATPEGEDRHTLVTEATLPGDV